MSHIRGRVHLPSAFGRDDDDERIQWVETDPRRAPLRNDLVSALQVALCPVVFWFIFFTGYYPIRGVVGATVVMTLILFVVAFIFKWARMASARTRRATIRSVRRKLPVVAVVAVLIGALTFFTFPFASGDTAARLLGAIAAGAAAGVILLVLESYAVSVPAADMSGKRDDTWMFLEGE